MKPKAQKKRKNKALLHALVDREFTQRRAAALARIPEVRLSSIVCGSQQATPDEKKALARVLRYEVSELFPEQQAVSA